LKRSLRSLRLRYQSLQFGHLMVETAAIQTTKPAFVGYKMLSTHEGGLGDLQRRDFSRHIYRCYSNSSKTPAASARMPITTLMPVKLIDNRLINPSRINQIDSSTIPNLRDILLIISSHSVYFPHLRHL
jgi:hypothetical protein